MKTLLRLCAVSLFALLSVSFYSCEEMTPKKTAEKAANEICDCYAAANGSVRKEEKCKEDFYEEYGTSYSLAFFESFNEHAKKCGIELTKETKSYSINLNVME